MTLLFKIIGFALIITTCGAIGFLKANTLNARTKKLHSLQKSVTMFKQLLRLGGGETDKLIARCFDSYPIDYTFLLEEDRRAIESLINEIGMLDSESACNRCDITLALLDALYADALKNYRELGKLYKSVGALFGIFICIFFI